MATLARDIVSSSGGKGFNEALNELRQHIHVVQLPAGESVFHQGAPITGVHLLYEGCVKLEHAVLCGKRFLIGVIYPVTLINYCALGSEGVYRVSAKTVKRSAIGFVSPEVYLDWLSSRPEHYAYQMKQFAKQIAWMQQRLGQLAYSSVRDQLLLLLNYLSHEGNGVATKDCKNVEIDLCEQELAEMVGATRETVVRELTGLKSQGLITVNSRTIVVKDLRLLERALQQMELLS